jgi:hypothetical protein
MAVTPTSHTSAHSITTTVAPFRAWRDSRLTVARGPMRATIKAARLSEVWPASATTLRLQSERINIHNNSAC